MTEPSTQTGGRAPRALRALGEMIAVIAVYLIIGGFIALFVYMLMEGFSLESLKAVSEPGGEEKMFKPAFLATPLLMAVTLLAIYGFQRLRGETLAEIGLAKPQSWGRAVVIGLGLTGIVFGVSVGAEWLGSQLGLEHTVRDFMIIRDDFGMFIFSMTAIAWFAAGFGEEVLFRGFLIRNFSCLFGGSGFAVGVAVLLQAIVFGLLHFNQGPGGVLAVFMIAMVFGVSFLLLKRNLWPLIFAHALYDNIGLAMLYYYGP